MIDNTDDWMNSPRSSGWDHAQPDPSKIEHLIERQRRRIVTGNVGSITEWGFWSKHDTAEERDATLTKLRALHPAWSLRKRDRNPGWS